MDVRTGDLVVPVNKIDKPVLTAADGSAITRSDVVSYYLEVAEFLLPHLSGRCLTAVRYTRGVAAGGFYVKGAPADRPEWMATLPGPGNGGQEYLHVENVAGLVWLASIDAFELHVPLAMAAQPDDALGVMFDLDPGAGVGISECCQVALWIAERVGRSVRFKTSGSKGVQLYLPLDEPAPFEETQRFAKAIAAELAGAHPEMVTAAAKGERGGKVFIDWLQNMPGKTTVAAYSLRGRVPVGVSTPLTLDEISAGADGSHPLQFAPEMVLERVRQFGDLYRADA